MGCVHQGLFVVSREKKARQVIDTDLKKNLFSCTHACLNISKESESEFHMQQVVAASFKKCFLVNTS